MSKFERVARLGGLIITRKIGDQIIINKGEIKIEIVDIKGKSVRIAIKAHKEIEIQRLSGQDAAD